MQLSSKYTNQRATTYAVVVRMHKYQDIFMAITVRCWSMKEKPRDSAKEEW